VNAPFAHSAAQIRTAQLDQPGEADRIAAWAARNGGTIFHMPAWLAAVEAGTGQQALGLIAERGGELAGWLPLTLVHSPVFGRALVSSGFAVEGGALADSATTAHALCAAAEELAQRHSCASVELRGGLAPGNWSARSDTHAIFRKELAEGDEEQLLAIPRKQRAEVRKGLASDLEMSIGTAEADRAAHYAVYSESVRNLGTPVFPRSLFDAVLDRLDADILTIRGGGVPVASVLSLYHDGAVLPYWGGGTPAARRLRANDRMYFELMLHARRRGCTTFDFGRSKTGSGAFAFKRNWGFEPEPLHYTSWTAPGRAPRDANPESAHHAARIAMWKRLPLAVTNRLGPVIARGLG
jgi:FemAB-related protein (PEP-CTERM system-associated)